MKQFAEHVADLFRRRPVFIGASVAALGTLVFFWPLLVGQTFSTVAGLQQSTFPWHAQPQPFTDAPQSDQAAISYPWQAFVTRSLRSGDPPLWNPLSFGGQPFLSNGQSAVLYPPRLVAALLFSPSGAHDFLSLFHVFGAGLAMFLLCRELQLRTPGSLLGATTWMFASFNMAWLHLEVVAPVTVLLPLCVLLVRRAVERPGVGNALAGAAVLGVTLLSGHLLFMAMVWAVAIGYGLLLLLGGLAPWRARQAGILRKGAGFAAITLGGPLLFAAVLLPTAMALRSSPRKPLPYAALHERSRSDPKVLFRLIQPPAAPLTEDTLNREMVFVGTAAAGLAVLGLLQRTAASFLGALLAGGVLALAFDTPLLKAACGLVPGLMMVFPLGRLFFLLNFATALLAGSGLDALVRGGRWLGRRAAKGGREGWRRAADVLTHVVAAALVTVNTFQEVGYARTVNPPFHPRDRALLFPETPLVKAARKHISRHGGRLISIDAPATQWSPPVLYGGTHMVFALPAAGGYDSVVPDCSLQVLRVAAGDTVEFVLRNPDPGSYRSRFPVDRVRFELLAALGVTGILTAPGLHYGSAWTRTEALRLQPEYAGPDGELFRVPDAPGDAWLVYRSLVVDSPGDAMRELTDPAFDFRRDVILRRIDAPSSPGAGYVVEPRGDEVRVKERSNNRLVFEVTAHENAWLVNAATWDRGWTATVDGEPAPVLQANYAFRAVRVPAGTHTVEMTYVPPGSVPGLACSGIVLLAAAALVGHRRRTRTRAAPERKPLEETQPS